jgi:hypothetical protein
VRILDKAASSMVPVMLVGPRGSEIELLARLVHERSSNREGPFVTFRCGSVGDDAMPEAILGRVAGVRLRSGVLDRARNGTLFLDEVGRLTGTVPAGHCSSFPTRIRLMCPTAKLTGAGSALESASELVAAEEVDRVGAGDDRGDERQGDRRCLAADSREHVGIIWSEPRWLRGISTAGDRLPARLRLEIARHGPDAL